MGGAKESSSPKSGRGVNQSKSEGGKWVGGAKAIRYLG